MKIDSSAHNGAFAQVELHRHAANGTENNMTGMATIVPWWTEGDRWKHGRATAVICCRICTNCEHRMQRDTLAA